jgi:hypothetical protein
MALVGDLPGAQVAVGEVLPHVGNDPRVEGVVQGSSSVLMTSAVLGPEAGHKRDYMYQVTIDVASIRIWLRDPGP